MSGNSLPADLKKVLENHVEQADIENDEELKGILNRLTKLNESVEKVKASILVKSMSSLTNYPQSRQSLLIQKDNIIIDKSKSSA